MRKVLVAAVATAMAAAGPALAQQVKVGFVATFSGPNAALGDHLYQGFQVGLDHAGGKLGGLATEILKEDDQLKPDVGVQVVRKLIDRDKVDVVSGVVFSNVMMAIHKPLTESKTPMISANAGPSPIAGKLCSPFFFAASWQNDQSHEAVGQHLQTKGVKRVYLMAPNYQAGRDGLAGFKRYFKGEVLGEVYTTVNQPDYSAELAQIRAAKPEAVYVFYPGGMGVNFVKQYGQAGLTKDFPLYSAFTVDATTLAAQGDAAVGTFTAAFWTADLDNAANKRFVADYQKKYGSLPSTFAAQGYDAARLLDAAIRGAGGKVSDRDALAAAIKKASFESVRGPFRFNTNNFPIHDFYLVETVKAADGSLQQVNRGVVFKDHADAYVGECAMK
ncbi:amino acid/amide ABC transporter substrate-binding protein (HAAT family) [Stella humosa]|uniref:Amino acid/amide ABC transporter substrate-binding protein (HAAT family) n=1 Tax=Stella humosa TaxID=94 RepID=A0A3N1MFP1_9PROT|nr:ABC transporter substrate-binding protein [Stella humosa]ROQ01547.1 amino acid/amide ABC transporter substrate-binding protein (HAAT family) [Stella humosa]BBK31927.1 ABC transporter substrate-binding protein [Stella humosa]